MFLARQLTDYIYLFIAILMSLTFHELSHAYVSYKLGDPTAKQLGRLTLNPLQHLDPLGTIMLIISSLSGYGFGWAKPVPINPMYYKNRRKGTILVSVAGPLSNLLLAIVFYTIYLIAAQKSATVGIAQLKTLAEFMISINLGLAAFNLLPFPPLDGSKILGGFLPPKYYYQMLSVENYISFAFLFIVMVKPSLLNIFLNPLIRGLVTIMDTIAIPIAKLFV